MLKLGEEAVDEYEWNAEFKLKNTDKWQLYMTQWVDENNARQNAEALSKYPDVWYAVRVIRRRKPGPVEVVP